jgi:hypothetical protein
MKTKMLTRLNLAIGFLLVAMPVVAHHSDSVFNQNQLVTVTGTVTDFSFANPHTIIRLEAKDSNGNVVSWVVTGGAPNHMVRSGWNQKMFKAGEQLTISGFQYTDGRPIMLQMKIVRANGESVTMSDSETNRLKRFSPEGDKKGAQRDSEY